MVWIIARRMFDFTTAVVVSLLLIFEPNVLANGSLIMTDVPVTCVLLFAVSGFYLWIRHRTEPFLLLTALATGLTLLVKQSGVALLPILGVLSVSRDYARPYRMHTSPDSFMPNVSIHPEGTDAEPQGGSGIQACNSGLVFQSRMPAPLAFFLAFVLCATYMLSYLKTGWLPEDDGVLAQSALRVLHSQLPHRDFVETYTGGLSCLNALAFWMFGVNLASLRIMMFIFFLAWLPAVFYVASRFLSAIPAAAVMVLATVWGVPNYPTPMPSWYNLFFAIFGAAALLRYLETEHRRWLLLAGLCGGLSLLVKITGLYYVAACLIFLIFREQILNGITGEPQSRPAWAYRVFSIAGLLAFLGMIVLLLRHRFDDREFVHFFLPSATLVGYLIWRELHQRNSAEDSRRFASLFGMATPFVIGFAIPISFFLGPYVMSRSLGVLIHGVFGQGMARAQALGLLVRPGHAQYLYITLPLVALVAAGAFWKRNLGPLFAIPVAGAGVLLLLVALRSAGVAQVIWLCAALSTPVFVILGVAVIMLRPSFADDLTPQRQQQAMLMLALVAVCSLIQFPFSVKIYFCYFAPLLALAVVAVSKTTKRLGNPHVLACLLVFYTLFAVTRVAPSVIYDNQGFKIAPTLETLNLPRAGALRVAYPQIYEAAIRTVLEHAGSGPVLATPECPEVYFLSGLNNPTNTDGALSANDILRAIQNNDDMTVVVINDSSVFAQSTLTPELIGAVSTRFPQRVRIGKYWVFWR
ncbi:MAG: glycosyltransferase family 39 protein [Terriglobales bacterium]